MRRGIHPFIPSSCHPLILPQDHAETKDRAIALGRYNSFARYKGTCLIKPTERVLVEGMMREGKK